MRSLIPIVWVLAAFGLLCSCGNDNPGPADDDDSNTTGDDDTNSTDDDDASDDDTGVGDDDQVDDDDAGDDDTTLSEEDFWDALVLFLCQQAMVCWPDVVEHKGWENVEDCLPVMYEAIDTENCVYTGMGAQECL